MSDKTTENKIRSGSISRSTGMHGDRKSLQKQLDRTIRQGHSKKFFQQVEIAKKEWEKTMDCVSDMIILTDSEGIIKRVNKSVKKFTKKPYKEIIGVFWEDLIIENDLEATTLNATCAELFHRFSGRWFELRAYPFEDIDLGFSGNVLTIHETTEIKQISEKLQRTNAEIEENRIKLYDALSELYSLIQNVIERKDHSVRFRNPNLKKCYEIMNCTNTACPCHGKEATRCWQIAGTFCGGKAQGTFAQKYESCAECKVYQAATSDPIYQIGEHFNNMMNILGMKRKKT